MHRLLGAVHEAAVQLSKLPIRDVAAALLQVLQGSWQDPGQADWPGAPGLTGAPRGQPKRPLPSAALGGNACWGPGS